MCLRTLSQSHSIFIKPSLPAERPHLSNTTEFMLHLEMCRLQYHIHAGSDLC